LSATVDHVKPVSAGGSNDPRNLRAAHWHCNEEKGDRLLGIEMGISLEAA
jgi:5-methylcytosine-specific restriction endonuclease McrA